MGGSHKGSSFERDISVLLSRWWSGGDRDDIFYRTATSGARATVRSKANKSTFGQYGDVQATDPIGQPLIDLCTIELKRGYSKSTFADLIEDSTTANAKPCMYAKFIQQAKEDSDKANAPWWLLIVKRDRKKPIVIFPRKLFDMHWKGMDQVRVFRRGKFNIRVALLEDFLEYVEPSDLIEECSDEDDECKRCTKPTCYHCSENKE